MAEKRILIVEDDFDNTTLVRLLLEREKLQVITAQNGQVGFDKAVSEMPNLIVLDLDMPVMDGWGMIEKLQANESTNKIPVVVVTAHLVPDEQSKVAEAGGVGYVFKPFQPSDLVREIKRCL